MAVAAMLMIGCKTRSPAPAPPAPSATTPPAASAPAAEIPAPECPARRVMDHAAWSPDGKMLATSALVQHAGPSNQQVDLWDLAKGTWVRSLDAGMSGASGRWAPGGWFLTTADPSTGMGHVVLWSATMWTPRYETDFYCITNVDFDPAGHQMFIAGCNGMIVRLDTRTGKATSRPEAEAHLNGDVDVIVKVLGASGPLLVIDQSWDTQLLDPITLRRRVSGPTEPVLPENGVQSLSGWSVSPDGSLLATAKETGTLEVLRTRTLARAKVLIKAGPAPMSRAVDWLGSDRLLVSSRDGTVKVMSLAGEVQSLLPVSDLRSCLPRGLGSPGGKLVAVIDGACKLALWDVAAGSFRWTRPLPTAVVAPDDSPEPQVAWSPAGDLLAVIPAGGPLQIFTSGGEMIRETRLGGAVADKAEMAWSPDGSFVAIGSGAIHVLRIGDGEELALSLFEGEPGPDAVVTARTSFAGKSSLARCADPALAFALERPGLLADFFAPRPLGERR
jgi:WD40 repeat protein